MVQFVNRVRLFQVSTGAPSAPTPLVPEVLFRTGPAGTAVETVAEAIALIPAGQRPPQADWWQYAIEWQVQAEMLPTVRGVLPYTLASPMVGLVVDVDFWQTSAQRTNGDPPLTRNTFTFMFSSRPRDWRANVLAIVEAYLRQCTWQNIGGDQRDPRIVTSKLAADDPRGLLTNVANIDGVARSLDGTWVRG